MGLDIILGLVILLAAVRGWLQGFIHQAIRLGAIVASVYLADPVRKVVKPYLLPHLSTLQPDLIDRFIWWVAAFATCLVLVTVASTIVKMTKKPSIPGGPKGSRNDQFAGFLMGGIKGLVIVAFVTAGIQKHALQQLQTVEWAKHQVDNSLALKWNEQFEPAPRIWNSRPVQHFVSQIHEMGVRSPDEGSPGSSNDPAGASALRTASRSPSTDGIRHERGETEGESDQPPAPALDAPGSDRAVPAPPAPARP